MPSNKRSKKIFVCLQRDRTIRSRFALALLSHIPVLKHWSENRPRILMSYAMTENEAAESWKQFKSIFVSSSKNISCMRRGGQLQNRFAAEWGSEPKRYLVCCSLWTHLKALKVQNFSRNFTTASPLAPWALSLECFADNLCEIDEN